MVIHAKGVPQQLAYLAVSTVYKFPVNENAAFIAAAREALPALLAENEKLRAERDFAWRGLQDGTDRGMEWQKECNVWIDRAAAAEAERDRLRAALKPFAIAGDHLTAESPSDMCVIFSANGNHVRICDLRAARAALEQKP
jgi:hypothetical protein